MEKGLVIKGESKFYIEQLQKMGIAYKTTVSNYTTSLESEIYSMRFLKKRQSENCFAGYAKVKSNLKDKPIPDIQVEDILYFSHDLRKDIFIPLAFSIDLKSAYATTMFLRGLITKETFNYVMKLAKPDRLASIGMLASKKETFSFDNKNKLTGYELNESAYAPFFYQCAMDTFEIIRSCRQIAGSDYLYSWVDCIYLTRPDTIADITNYLNNIGFNASCETLHQFKVSRDSIKVTVSFWKQKEDVCVKKEFHLPHNNNSAMKEFIQVLKQENKQRYANTQKIRSSRK